MQPRLSGARPGAGTKYLPETGAPCCLLQLVDPGCDLYLLFAFVFGFIFGFIMLIYAIVLYLYCRAFIALFVFVGWSDYECILVVN